MSPDPTQAERFFGSFPRVSGDEPIKAGAQALWTAFSPRERG